MKNKAHLMALVMKKCAELKLDKNIDAFCEYQPHCSLLRVEVFKNWGEDSSNPIYKASVYTDGSFNTDTHASNLPQIIEDLDDVYLGLGIA